MNFQELIDECLFGKKPKKKKTAKKAASVKKEEKTPKANKKAPKTVKKSVASEIEERVKKETIKEAKGDVFAKYFWWVKKGDYYGLATFSEGKFISDEPEVTAAGLAKAILTDQKPEEIFKDFKNNGAVYSKPILIKWLVTKEDVKKSGAKDYIDFIDKQDLPPIITPDEKVVKDIQAIFKKAIPSPDNITPEEIRKAEEEMISQWAELPIPLKNKKVSDDDQTLIKNLMKKGTNLKTKYAEANVGTVIKDEDVPKLIEIAKKELG